MVSGSPAVGLMSRLASPSVRSLAGTDGAEAIEAFEARWRQGDAPALEDFWSNEQASAESVATLAALVKADLRGRFARGETPAVAEYLERFPRLREADERVVSLVYEEYCLREEQGESLDAEGFCNQYEPWRDSLASQLRYHRLLSQVVASPTSPPRFPEPGERFQGFHLQRLLGRGGVARVYLATEPEVGDREVALKISRDRGKEPSIQGRLDHANIVRVLSVTPPDPETGLRGLCMPYQSGLSLDEIIRWVKPASKPRGARVLWDALASQSRSDWEQGPHERGWLGFPLKGTYAEGVAWVVLTLAKALQHAHSRGVMHRDVKPANVLLTFRDGPQLLDFNLAHDPHSADHAEAALRGGTLPYMAPEQLEAFLDPDCWDDVGETADLYALGLLLVELVTGRRPEAPDPKLPLPRAIRELLDRRSGWFPCFRDVNPAIPHALESIAAGCLASDPADRYPSAQALAEDLQRFLERKPLRYAINRSRTELASNWLRRNRVVLACGAALLIGGLLVPFVRQWKLNPASSYVAAGRAAIMSDEPGHPKAREAFETALEIEPKSWSAMGGLANVAYLNKDYEKSLQYHKRAIELAELPEAQCPPTELSWLYLRRGMAALHLGNAIQNSTKDERSFLAAAPYYHAARDDIARARKFADVDATVIRKSEDLGQIKLFDELCANIELYSGWAEMGLGDVESEFDHYEDSVAHFEAAERYLARALEREPKNQFAPDRMSEIKLRLAVDLPKREALRKQGALSSPESKPLSDASSGGTERAAVRGLAP